MREPCYPHRKVRVTGGDLISSGIPDYPWVFRARSTKHDTPALPVSISVLNRRRNNFGRDWDKLIIRWTDPEEETHCLFLGKTAFDSKEARKASSPDQEDYHVLTHREFAKMKKDYEAMAIKRTPRPTEDETKAVATAKKASTALAVPDIDPFADAGAGTENVRAQDLIIPRLTLLHEMSKVTKKNRPEYIKGATGGMFCIGSLQKLFDGEEGIFIIPVTYTRRLIEWTPIDAGGGLIRMDVPEEELEGMERKNPGVYLTDNDTEVVVTPEYYALIVDDMDGSSLPVVMSLTGKKAAVSKRWNTLIMSQRAINPRTNEEVQMPFWFNTYHMVAVADNNEKGDFYIPSVTVFKETLKLDHGEIFYRRAREFYNAVKTGTAKAADIEDTDR